VKYVTLKQSILPNLLDMDKHNTVKSIELLKEIKQEKEKLDKNKKSIN
jgi:hypothetical protein